LINCPAQSTQNARGSLPKRSAMNRPQRGAPPRRRPARERPVPPAPSSNPPFLVGKLVMILIPFPELLLANNKPVPPKEGAIGEERID
jgi:hypothetical protein